MVHQPNPLHTPITDHEGATPGAASSPGTWSRRRLLERTGAAAATIAAAGALGTGTVPGTTHAAPARFSRGPLSGRQRAEQAYNIRLTTATNQRAIPLPSHSSNGDEVRYGTARIGSYSKGLPHNALGEVVPAAYAAYLAALASGKRADFDAVPMGGKLKQLSIQSAYGYTLEGRDPFCLYSDPAPSFDSAQAAGEMAELYWQALARDVPFASYDSDPLIAIAAADLSRFSDFRGPKAGAAVTSGTVFRGATAGDLTGPYISQFLWMPVAYGPLTMAQRYPIARGVDYLTAYPAWLANQQGTPLAPPAVSKPGAPATPPGRYIATGRDLAAFVHSDFTYQAHLNACLALLHMGAPLDPGNPYAGARTQVQGVTFGSAHILDLVARAALEAVRAVWYQKWLVHRRLRPEAFGGRIHNHRTGAAPYPIHADLFRSPVLDRAARQHGSYLLPLAYPEGAPLHPSYPAAHVTIAGACVTMLKAFFDESFTLPQPVVAGADGSGLLPYGGPPLTVGGELNKLASNIHFGRDFAGVHYRSDGMAGALLGEAVAIGVLTDQAWTFEEDFHGFSLTTFDGTRITV